MSAPALVIFDMDGLMFDTERLALRSWRASLARYGLGMTDELFVKTLGVSLPITKGILRDFYGEALPIDDVVAGRFAFVEQYLDEHGVPVMPGLYELLGVLEKRRIKTAVCTSTERPRAEKLLKMADVYSRFAYTVTGDEIKRGKPMPDIFLKAAEMAGAQPRRCVVLEDSEAGILAASRAGMQPVMVPDLKQPDEPTRGLLFRQFHSLGEAARFFETNDAL